jgi:3-hydroxyisobutyrate dehydrogenase
MHIGIAGIGAMGSNIGARLMEVGHKLSVWNRTAATTGPLADAGAGVARTPAELAGAAESSSPSSPMLLRSTRSTTGRTGCCPAT